MQDDPSIPAGLCQCGCGGKTRVPSKNDSHNGRLAGVPLRFIRGHHFHRPAVPVLDRIYAKVKVHPLGCWEWQGYLNERGYGVTPPAPGMYGRKVHRLVFEAEVGPIPDGLTIDHLCMNKRCVNWAHMDVVTRGENTRRAFNAGLSAPHVGTRLTACLRGHPYDETNTYVRPSDGKRYCRECQRIRDRERYLARTSS